MSQRKTYIPYATLASVLQEQLYDLWRQFPRKGDTKFVVKKQAGSHYLVEISGLAQNVDMLALVDLTKHMKNLTKEAGLLLEDPGSKELDPNRYHGFFYFAMPFKMDDEERFWDLSYSVGYAGKKLGLTNEQVVALREFVVTILKGS